MERLLNVLEAIGGATIKAADGIGLLVLDTPAVVTLASAITVTASSVSVKTSTSDFDKIVTVSTQLVEQAEKATQAVQEKIEVSNGAVAIRRQIGPSKDLLDELAKTDYNVLALTGSELSELKRYIHYSGSAAYPAAISNMAPLAQRKFFNLFKDYHGLTGKRVILKSAWRSAAKQAQLKKQYKSRAAGANMSPHAIGAVDIDRRGEFSPQVAEMKRLGLLNKHGVWNPPFVGESWHIEDPVSVYFRFWKKSDTRRTTYSKYVSSTADGKTHDSLRRRAGIFDIRNSYTQAKRTVQKRARMLKLSERETKELLDYMLVAMRSESFFGKHMVSKSGALGWLQFMPKTAEAYKLKYPMQLDESVRAAIQLRNDNKKMLKKYGIAPSNDNLYLAHVVGAYGYSLIERRVNGEALDPKESAIVAKVISSNLPTSTEKTPAAFKTFFKYRLDVYRADVNLLDSL